MVIHGGYWRSQYGAELGEPLARDLAAHGMPPGTSSTGGPATAAVGPIPSRTSWPASTNCRDVAGDHGLGLGKVVALGHSAGGHLAVWAAGRASGSRSSDARRRSPAPAKTEDNAVHLTGVVSQSGLLNLAAAEKLNLSNGAVCNLMGG